MSTQATGNGKKKEILDKKGTGDSTNEINDKPKVLLEQRPQCCVTKVVILKPHTYDRRILNKQMATEVIILF